MAAAKKKWRQLNPEAVAREARRYAQRHPEQVEVRRKRYEERYPERLASNRAVWTAVKNGELVKPLACEDCERAVESRQLHGHHEDYSKPLEVEWLCAKCHKDRHGGMTKRTDRR
jgi:hypothetical protein